MKEATGELNITMFIISALAIIIAFFYFTIWPLIKGNLEATSQCSKAICDGNPDDQGEVTCHLKGKTETFKCVYKG